VEGHVVHGWGHLQGGEIGAGEGGVGGNGDVESSDGVLEGGQVGTGGEDGGERGGGSIEEEVFELRTKLVEDGGEGSGSYVVKSEVGEKRKGDEGREVSREGDGAVGADGDLVQFRTSCGEDVSSRMEERLSGKIEAKDREGGTSFIG